MNKPRLFLLVCMILCITEYIPAMGKSDAEKPPKIEISGKVRLVGSGPLPSLVISGEDREWYIDPKEEKKLIDLQHQTVTVKGREYYADLVFADGSSGGRQYYLRDITVVHPK